VSAIGVHVLWWRTAEANSHALAATINEQIVSAVEKELDAITAQARAAHTAIRTLFVQNVLETGEADKRERVNHSFRDSSRARRSRAAGRIRPEHWTAAPVDFFLT
jgi:hypothetical protein